MIEIRIGLGSCGVASGAEPVRAALEQAAAKLGARSAVKAVGCNGMCYREPMVEVAGPDGRIALYGNVTPETAPSIVRKHLRPGWFLTRYPAADALPDAGKQKRIVLENCGEIDPLRIDDYLVRDGYRALADCIQNRTPDEIIGSISDAGLRGRGGAGFPTARKWAMGRAQADPIRYVICNGDEGDPGAFMDRLVLESDPHRVLEGLAIAAYAVNAVEGYLYIRTEYPLAVDRVRGAIRQAESRGLFGTLASRSSRRGRAPLSAARRPRSSSRSKAGAACRSCGLPIPWSTDFAGIRLSSTTSRRWLVSRGSCATAPPRSPPSAHVPVVAPRSFR